MYFLRLFQVISRSCFCFTPAAPTIVHSVLHTCSDWPVISIYTLRCLLSTIHARGSIQSIHLSGLRDPHPPPPPVYYRFRHCFYLLGRRDASGDFFRCLDTRLRTVVTCSGREATCPLATILALESPTTSEPQANQLNQSNENDLEEVDQITRNNELESAYSLGVKGNLKNNLGFWRSIGALDFILSIIGNGYKLPFVSFPLPVKLRNNKSARLHVDFVDQAVLELVNSGPVRMVNE